MNNQTLQHGQSVGVLAEVERHLRRYNHPPIPKRPSDLSSLDQAIESPVCLLDESVVSGDEESSDGEGTWTDSYSTLSTSFTDVREPFARIPSAVPVQSNTNYVLRTTPINSTSNTTPANVQQQRPQSKIPIKFQERRRSVEPRPAKLDPNIRDSLDEIRRCVNGLTGDSTLHQEVKDLLETVRGLTLRPDSSNNSDGKLKGVVNDIRTSLRAKAPSALATRPYSPLLFRAIEEIRDSVQALRAMREEEDEDDDDDDDDDDCEEPEPKFHVTTQVLSTLNDIRQSLRAIEGNEHKAAATAENNIVLEALKDIRQSIQGMANSVNADELKKDAGLVETLKDIRCSVQKLAREDSIQDGQGNMGNSSRDRATDAMAQSIEELQRAVGRISEQLMSGQCAPVAPKPIIDDGDDCTEDTVTVIQKTVKCPNKKKKKREGKCKKSKSAKCETETDNEESESCFESEAKPTARKKECCKDSACDKLIKFLISQNAGGGKCAPPSVQYICPPVCQPPRFVAPYFRPPPRPPMTLPPTSPMVGCPQPRFAGPPQGYSMAAPPLPPPQPQPPPPPPATMNYPNCYPQQPQTVQQSSTFAQPPPPPPPPPPPQQQQSMTGYILPQSCFQTSAYAPTNQPPPCYQTSMNFGGQSRPAQVGSPKEATCEPMAFTLNCSPAPANPTGAADALNLVNQTFRCTQVPPEKKMI